MNFSDWLAKSYQNILTNLDGTAEGDHNTVKHLVTASTMLALQNVQFYRAIVEIIEQYIFLSVSEIQFL